VNRLSPRCPQEEKGKANDKVIARLKDKGVEVTECDLTHFLVVRVTAGRYPNGRSPRHG
jgi:hypothetical protein